MIEGRCECGQVRFQAEGPVTDYSHCYCSQCRRLHGAAFATFAGVKKAGFQYTSGADVVKTYASSHDHRRVFCSTCGSNILVALTGDPDMLYLAMGVVNGNPDLPEQYHIFTGSKAPWHEISGPGERFDAAPPDSFYD